MHDSRVMWFYSVFGVTVIKSHLCVYSCVFFNLTLGSSNGGRGWRELDPRPVFLFFGTCFWEPWNNRYEAWRGRRVWEEIGLEGENEGCNELKSFSTFKSVMKSGLRHNEGGFVAMRNMNLKGHRGVCHDEPVDMQKVRVWFVVTKMGLSRRTHRCSKVGCLVCRDEATLVTTNPNPKGCEC